VDLPPGEGFFQEGEAPLHHSGNVFPSASDFFFSWKNHCERKLAEEKEVFLPKLNIQQGGKTSATPNSGRIDSIRPASATGPASPPPPSPSSIPWTRRAFSPPAGTLEKGENF